MAASLEFRLTGGAANSDPDASLGGDMSSTEISGTALNNLFDDVDETEASAGDIEYRAIDIYNSGDANAEDVTLWIDDETDSGDTQIDVGLDAGTQSIANEDTAPSSPTITFSHPTSEGSPLSIGMIANGSAQRVWVRRTVGSSAGNHANDLCGITVRFA